MRILFIGIIFGVYLLYSYDYLRIFRRIIKHIDFMVMLEDLFYCIHAGIILFLILQNECDGKLRYYVILMTFFGMLLYYFALGRFAAASVVWVLEVIGNFIMKGKRRLTGQFQKVKITIRKYLCKLKRKCSRKRKNTAEESGKLKCRPKEKSNSRSYPEAEEWNRKEVREKERGEKFLLSERKKRIY